MTTGLLIGFISGLIVSAIWHVFLGLLSPKVKSEVGETVAARVGPFLYKKEKPRRKPVSHDEHEDYIREMKQNGKML